MRSSWLSLNNLASDRVKDKEREGVRAREDRTGKRGTRVKERTTAEHTKTRCSQVGRRGRVTERQRDRERQRERERERERERDGIVHSTGERHSGTDRKREQNRKLG